MRVPLPAARMTAFIATDETRNQEAGKPRNFRRLFCGFGASLFRPMKRTIASCLLLIFFAAKLCAAGKQLTGQHAPAMTPALAPAESQKQFVVPEGFEVRLFAAEPDVVNPVAMTWDERGRLWVLELYEYPLGAPAGKRGRDRIKILEDTDNDGRADKVTIFADGFNLATGLALGNGGVYVAQAPDLLFLRDTNHDDHADTREVLLTGFGLDDRHELLNGFNWGPDGWLYMTHGVFTRSKVKIPEASEPGVEMNAAVARFHPVTRKFEIFADGTSNPWGVDFDAQGNAFVSACVIDHLFHMAPGGIYARQGGTPGNPFAYELLPSIVEHKHHMAAYSGICIYQGNNFPEEYRGHVFFGNIHQNAVNHDRLVPNGSSFKAVAEKDFVTTSDGWFRPVSEQVGPDGALWIADWCDKYPCYQNAQADPEGVDRERGRIWRVVYVGKAFGKQIGSRPDVKMNLEKLKSKELVKLLEYPNEWQKRMAQRLLVERFNFIGLNESGELDLKNPKAELPDVIPLLRDKILNGKIIETRLAAMWTLLSGDCFDHNIKFLQPLLFDEDPAIRKWGVNLTAHYLREMTSVIAKRAEKPSKYYFNTLSLLENAASDPDASVRLAVATAIRQLVSSSLTVDRDIDCDVPIGKILAALIKSSADAKDPLLPFMIWMAGEPSLAKNPKGGLDWLANNGAATMPLSGILARKAMRRICDTQETPKLDLAVTFLEKISGNNELALAAMDGLIEGQKAKPLLPSIETKSLFVKLNASGSAQLKERAQQLGTLWGNASAISATLIIINDASAKVDERIKSVEASKKLKNDAAREALVKVIAGKNPKALVITAIHALGEIGGDSVSNELLKGWKGFSPDERTAAAEVLVARKGWTRALLSALETKTISASELPMSAIRSLGQSNDEFIRQRATLAIGRIRPANVDKQRSSRRRGNLFCPAKAIWKRDTSLRARLVSFATS